ncbi:hydrophobin 3 [Moniliophthora roreri MCA 2997]|uniref:Hydrophobin n=1 Tax=Moniliophthora roreri (strain MCA 2997) TaxID=1381753 RepID=V2WX15_MONRO|nr:hydrophobin 3 [Moniliophthora roreri MCA 2997]
MQFKSTATLFTLAISASMVLAAPSGNTMCGNQTPHCCNEVTEAQNVGKHDVGPLSGLLGSLGLVDIVLNGVTGNVGLGCSVLGNNCQQQAVCCDNVTFKGLVNLGCSPINIL